jgi:hypothetical protein
MFLDVTVTYRRGGPQLTAREVHDIGLRVEGDAVCRAPTHGSFAG